MSKLVVSWLLILSTVFSVEIKDLKLDQNIMSPKVYHENVPAKSVKKIIHDNYVQSIDEVNF